MIYEIINPSDKVTIEATDSVLASVAVIILGEGAYGLYDEDDNTVLPIFRFSDAKVLYAWLKDHGIDSDKIQEYYAANGKALAAILESIVYGDATDRKALYAACEKMSPDDRLQAFAKWNDTKRSSMNDIGAAAYGVAKELRKKAGA